MKHSVIALIVIVAVATTHLPSPVRGTPGDFSYAFGRMVLIRGEAFNPELPVGDLNKYLEATAALHLSDEEDGEDKDEGEGEKDPGDDKKDDDTGPDRIWGAAKLG
jgi:hypothetical protein